MRPSHYTLSAEKRNPRKEETISRVQKGTFALAVIQTVWLLLAAGTASASQASSADGAAAQRPAAGGKAGVVRTADPLASPKTRAVLEYLASLQTRTSDRVVAGQSTGVNWIADTIFDDIHAATGKQVGLAGFDYFYANDTDTNTRIMAWSRANGLVTIHSHWNNPVTEGSYRRSDPSGAGSAWDTTSVDFVQLITPGTSLNRTFNRYLDETAAGLRALQDNYVVVLYRPFHEMNGNWFWWGGKDPTQFKNVWKYLFDYLTRAKGLHNLLWVYSSNAVLDPAYYPGPDHVDVVGVDLYGSPTVAKVAGYDQLAVLDKPFGITEWGPCAPSGCTSAVDISPLAAGLRTNMPKTAFWLEWGGSFGIASHHGAGKLLNDPWVVTRDEIALPDVTPPTVTELTLPARSDSLAVPVIAFTARDDVGVTGFCLGESASSESCSWSGTAPASHTFAGPGDRTLYAWVRDAAGNVSGSRSATVTISPGTPHRLQ